MTVNVTQLKEKSQAELEVSVPAQTFAAYIERAGKELTKDKPLKGFRPGKAPLAVVIEVFGQERVLHEAMEKALPHFFVQAALEHEVDAINRPSVTIKKLGLTEPFEFAAVVDILPEVTLADVKTLQVEKHEVEVKDEDVEQELKHLAKMRAKPLKVLRGAQQGDLVHVDFDVQVDGVSIEGGISKNHPVQLGDGHFVPDFEKGLTGIRAGEDRTFPMEFPADYAAANLAGKKAQVKAHAHSVQQLVLPALDDAFAKSLGKFEGLNDLKSKIKDNFQHEREHTEQDRRRGELMETLAEASTFGFIPEVLIEREIDNRLQELARMLTLQQRTVEDYLQKQNKTLADLRADLRAAAEKAVKIGLAMRTLARQQNIEVTGEEIEIQAQEYLARFPNPKAAKSELEARKLREDVTLMLRNQKTLAKLEELAA